MRKQHSDHWSRREFLGTAALAGTGALLGLRSESSAAESPPETTRLRLTQTPAACLAPQFVAEEFLRDERFIDVRYVKTTGGAGTAKALASGDADISMVFSGPVLIRVALGDPIV